jgi:outer membrane lipoprotein-sorting protein
MRRTTVTVLCVVALLTTAGCAGLGGSGEPTTTDELTRAEQIRQDSTAAMRNADSYRVSLQMNLTANGQSLTMTNDAVYDREARLARMDMSLYGTEARAYVDGSTMYVQTRGRWVVQNVSDRNIWESGNALANQREILASSNATVTGGDTVNGTAVTVLQVEPDPQKLKELVAQQQGRNFEGITIEDATYQMYVANETDRLRKMGMEMTMQISGQTAEAQMTAHYYGYDEPVDVTIPEDAKAAGSDDGTDDGAGEGDDDGAARRRPASTGTPVSPTG